MSPRCFFRAVICILLVNVFPSAHAYELQGDVAIEGRFFTKSSLYAGQEQHNASLALNGEFYREVTSGSSITIAPFVRLDSADSERTHADFREFQFIHLGDSWELKAGISKVFWGATEFVHLVDIVNQTDLVEDIYGEEKLGQPMVHLSFSRDWGIFDGFILPVFRQRTFPGKAGRLRSALVVDGDRTLYESSAEQHHIDCALRYSQTLGNVDWGLYQFVGTGREPILLENVRADAEAFLVPYYQQISQTGFDVQYVQGEWLWKGEALYRSGQGRNYAACTFGFEYTMYGVFNTSMDAGFIGEYVYDDRDESLATVYDNDLMFGLRLSLNDMEGSEILAGIIKDVRLSSAILSLEASRRFGESMKMKISGGIFSNISVEDPAYDLRNDDYIRMEVIYYF